MPLSATLPKEIGGGATVVIQSTYPFGDEATITVQVPTGHATTAFVRIPAWADAATLDGKPVANGTLSSVACAEGTTILKLALNHAIRVTRGWGVMEGPTIQAVVPKAFDPTATVSVPSSTPVDWIGEDGATFVPSRTPPGQDVRTGDPGVVSTVVNSHTIFGGGHYLSSVAVGLTYISGYTPAPGQHKKGCNVTLHALDAATGKDLGLLWASPELSNASYDSFHGYSKPVNGSASGLKIPNSKPIRLALKVNNNERNLQLRVADFSLALSWSADRGPEPPVPAANHTSPAANAATVTRGPLLYALRPKSNTKVTKRYDQLLPDRPLAVDYEIDGSADPWNFALALDPASFTFDAAPSANWSRC